MGYVTETEKQLNEAKELIRKATGLLARVVQAEQSDNESTYRLEYQLKIRKAMLKTLDASDLLNGNDLGD